MTEKTNVPPQSPMAASPVIKGRRSLSIVWLIPLVAVFIGGWLAYKALTEKGPMITISFESAEGLEAGKTKVKFKDVEVGVVEDIVIGEDLAQVILKVRMNKGTAPYLTAKTKFWVVTARISATEVSGLSTLLGGAYIGVEPSSEGKEVREFKGLEKPPIVTSGMQGKRFLLNAPRLGSLNPGSPIYFRQIKVGQVVDYNLDEDGGNVGVTIFIDSPYDQLVRQNTRFWISSGLDLQLTANGLRVDTESVVSLLIGGVAFTTFSGEELKPEAEENTSFKLYETHDEAQDERYTSSNDFFVEFSDSVRGLSVGAPVEFRGFRIGTVVDIELKADFEKLAFTTLVRVSVERERLNLPTDDTEDVTARFKRMIDGGLRAKMQTGNLLTGQLYVDLAFVDNISPVDFVLYNGLLVLPSVPSPTQEIMQDAAMFMKKLNQLPLEDIGRDLQSSIAGIDRLVNNPELETALHSLQQILTEVTTTTATLNSDTVPRVNAALAEMQTLVKDLDEWVSSDAPLYSQLRKSLAAISEAARSLSDLTDMLERRPEALIQGKKRED